MTAGVDHDNRKNQDKRLNAVVFDLSLGAYPEGRVLWMISHLRVDSQPTASYPNQTIP